MSNSLQIASTIFSKFISFWIFLNIEREYGNNVHKIKNKTGHIFKCSARLNSKVTNIFYHQRDKL